MFKKLIMLVLMTLVLHGTFIMEKGEPLRKVKYDKADATIEKSSINSAISELFYSNKSGFNDGKDGVNNVGKYNKNIRLVFTPKQKYVAIGFTNIFEYSSIEETKNHGYQSCSVTD
jgi:hypothetical protein